ncbi:hypothetical protein METP3_01937 [Methanosarcinales archaeon]|nr:hypothetical protein METP3_01937 [Methanosarcinales archaeon]
MLTKKEIIRKKEIEKIMRKGIILGIGILIILLALAGTGSAHPSYGGTCVGCHGASFNGTLFSINHKFDGVSAPNVDAPNNNCAKCHSNPPSVMSLTLIGQNYSIKHNGINASGYIMSGANCTYCHVDPAGLGNFTLLSTATYFKQIHKFNGIVIPNNATGCTECHTDVMVFSSLKSNGSSYNSTHRYNNTILASEMLSAPACGNCHADVINNNFTRLTGNATYLTSSVCEDCHKAKYDNWTNTLHRVMLTDNITAEAMNLTKPPGTTWNDISYVLVTKFQFDYIDSSGYFLAQNDSYETETKEFVNSSHAGGAYGTCGKCHTTGWNTSGWSNITLNGTLPGINGTFVEPGIGCERCHKPAGNGHQVVVNYSSNLCIECHSGKNHGTGWEKGSHAPPSAETPSDCTQCHSPFDKYKNNTITEENATNVACGVCHNIHDMTDNKYADTFSNNTFNTTIWSVVADAKLSFFNATASIAAGIEVFDDLISNVLIYPGSSSGMVGPINLTGRPVSEVLCSKCHYNHGLGHMPNINLTHGTESERATCVDCHMGGANATVGKDMMKSHDNDPLTVNSCGTAKCHTSMQKVIDEWEETLHNGKEVGSFAFNQTTGVGKSRQNSCNKCHSPMNWDPKKDSNTTDVQLTNESFKGITCGVCHNLHDMGAWLNKTNTTFGVEKPYALYEKYLSGTRYKGKYTMVANTTELCGNCHASVRIGRSEPGWPSGASNPNSTHGFPAKDIFVGSWKQTGMLKFECTSCHFAKMTRDENGTKLPVDQMVRGHSFQVNTTILMNGTACSSCHITGSTIGNLSTTIENVKTEIQDKYNATNVIVTAALADVKAYSGENTTSRAKIAQAYWNTKLVNSDKSWGVHNPEGTKKLLDDAVILANDAVSLLGQSTSSVDLVAGWNLVALNGTTSAIAPVSALTSVSGNVTVAWGYNTTSKGWEVYDPAMPASLDTLKTMVPGKGYWLYSTQNCKWTI